MGSKSARDAARDTLLPGTHADSGPSWDRFVGVMRLVLPVLAIIIGGLTVLWPFLNETEVSFTLSKEDVARSDGQIRMTNLKYVGTDAVDRIFRIEAASGLQDTPNAPRVRLTDIRAEMELEPGNPVHVEARTGIFRTKESTLSLVGGVHVETGNGYRLDMAGAEVDIKAHKATGQGTISGTSHLGNLEASRMEILVDEQEAIFDGGVRLHITPKRPDRSGAKTNGTGR